KGLSQSILRKLSEQVLSVLRQQYECLPAQLVEEHGFSTFVEAINKIHYPSPDDDIAQLVIRSHRAYKRLIVEELLAHYMVLREIKTQNQKLCAPAFKSDSKILKPFIDALPFSLTAAQQKV